MSALGNIIKKELKELLTPATILPIVFIAVIFGSIGSSMQGIQEELYEKPVLGYINELEQVLGEKSFLQQKTFLRRFIKRMEFKPEGVVLDYTIPVPVGKNRTSTREVLYIKQDGSAYRIRTGDLLLEREVS